MAALPEPVPGPSLAFTPPCPDLLQPYTVETAIKQRGQRGRFRLRLRLHRSGVAADLMLRHKHTEPDRSGAEAAACRLSEQLEGCARLRNAGTAGVAE